MILVATSKLLIVPKLLEVSFHEAATFWVLVPYLFLKQKTDLMFDTVGSW